MRSVLKWTLILLAVLVGLSLLGVFSVFAVTESRMEKVYESEVSAVPIPAELPDPDHGAVSVWIEICKDCHGPALSGQIMEDDPMTAVIVAPNLTPGEGGVGAQFTDEDWVRAIRHGIGPDGKSLVVMPSNIIHLSDEDLGKLIAYLKNLPPVNNEMPEITIGPMGRLFLLQDPSLLAAAVIDPTTSPPEDPGEGVSIARGEYLAFICTVCHGPDFAGGPNPSSGLNITPAGDIANWSEEDFFIAMRTGVRPDGETLDFEEMPWDIWDNFTDDELKSIWLYLQSLPPLESSTTPPAFSE